MPQNMQLTQKKMIKENLKNHFTKAVLNAIDPFSVKRAAIFPKHFALSLSLVLVILALINVATGPGVYAISMLFIIFELSIILIVRLGFGGFPLAFAIFHTIFEFTYIYLPIS